MNSSFVGEAIYIDHVESLPRIFETRVYNIASLLQRGEDTEEMTDWLIELLYTLTVPESWDSDPGGALDARG